jgi:hypothetical protein
MVCFFLEQYTGKKIGEHLAIPNFCPPSSLAEIASTQIYFSPTSITKIIIS